MSIRLDDDLEEIRAALHRGLARDDDTARRYHSLLASGRVLREDGSSAHLCVYTLPVDPSRSRVYLVNHRKARGWISPGGHLDRGETLLEAASRELAEELQWTPRPHQFSRIGLLTVTELAEPTPACSVHFDVWFLIRWDGTDFQPDDREFESAGWFDIGSARRIAFDENNRAGLDLASELGCGDD